MSRSLRAVVASGATLALLGTATAVPAEADRGHHGPPKNSVHQITRAVTAQGVARHLSAFQRITDRYGDRAAGRPGYRASVGYVAHQLRRAGYRPRVQEFTFDYFEENSSLERTTGEPTTWVDEQDFLRGNFDTGVPEGTASGPITPVDLVLNPAGPPNSSSSGCETTDFAGFPAGGIALVQRGTCDFTVKILNAQAAGAAGVVVMNEGQPGRTGLIGMIGDATGLTIPAVFATYDTGVDLASLPGATVSVTVDYTTEERSTWNVTAETRRGRSDNVVMAGAHLDSVQEGAGINDNGSGSAALLEVARKMAKLKIRPANKVRFAWWGAEENGLLGSEYYVSQLSEDQAEDIALYLNFDMVASPNYIFGVYDGDNSGGTAPDGFIPEGSAEIEDVFERFYTRRGEPFQDSEFSGRSDYGPFIAVGIPAGGLFTGAEGVKTEEEAARYGGVAGAAYDPCYHQPCDNFTGEGQDEELYDQLDEDYWLRGNINMGALSVNSDAIATAVVTFARSTEAVNGVRSHQHGKKHGHKHGHKHGKKHGAKHDKSAGVQQFAAGSGHGRHHVAGTELGAR
ncbi:M28 family metallopeptidase [Nocardioides pantholopis]|uniref:M28 family metallopeptidase n=1 Tax=Nocardioides pantholopis TaxID=2483798 RepID=UPI000FD74FC2|nr:M28 family metallopeptidase [Nocardioides pantholopis]